MQRLTTFFSTINFSTTTMIIIFVVLTAIWLINLRIFYRVNNQAAFITVGMLGMFVLMMVFVRPWATQPLARIVAALAGFVGRLTGTFTPFFKYGILFVATKSGSITLQIDFECSGIIEIMVYLSILTFYRVYSVSERAILSAVGFIYIIVANALRIIIIATMIHFGGEDMYYIAHTYVGRIFFYAATIILYFYVFTKSQVVRMKVGSFSYDKEKAAETKDTSEEKAEEKEDENK
ncbi:exosortase family protein XrtG [Butyrivibrio sp. XPD2006]|uniref:exosortase family protein XrtG n=1 Tax=Butyrivibrio sp. XPD2006 TaxID=1280668 RepID=UPI0003B6B5C0|nr:exosortase family protein XrtG [Butyrivibrio sp. XPD2006]